MSSPEVSGILENSKELDRIRKEQEEVLVEINKMHKKLQASEISSFNSLIQIKKKILKLEVRSLSFGTLDKWVCVNLVNVCVLV